MKHYQYLSILVLIPLVGVLVLKSLSANMETVKAEMIAAQPKPEKVSLIAVEEKLSQMNTQLGELKKSTETIQTTQKALDEIVNRNTEKLNTLMPVTITKTVLRCPKKKYVRKHNRKVRARTCVQK